MGKQFRQGISLNLSIPTVISVTFAGPKRLAVLIITLAVAVSILVITEGFNRCGQLHETHTEVNTQAVNALLRRLRDDAHSNTWNGKKLNTGAPSPNPNDPSMLAKPPWNGLLPNDAELLQTWLDHGLAKFTSLEKSQADVREILKKYQIINGDFDAAKIEYSTPASGKSAGTNPSAPYKSHSYIYLRIAMIKPSFQDLLTHPFRKDLHEDGIAQYLPYIFECFRELIPTQCQLISSPLKHLSRENESHVRVVVSYLHKEPMILTTRGSTQ